MAERSRGTGEPEQWKICPGIHGAAEVRLQAAFFRNKVPDCRNEPEKNYFSIFSKAAPASSRTDVQ